MTIEQRKKEASDCVCSLSDRNRTSASRFGVLYWGRVTLWGPDRVLAQIDKLTNNTYYYLYNGHGDVVQIVNTSGNIVNSYDYDIWGNFLEKTETTDNPFTYFGQTYDETTGLYYLRARYYDPATGRFTQQDPAEDGYNWYVYGGNNPVAYVDTTGNNRVLAIPWARQQIIWLRGVDALNLLGYNISAQMLQHSIRWFYATDVIITESATIGSERINGTTVINSLKTSFIINNEIDWQIKCANAGGVNSFYWRGVLAVNDTTDLYVPVNLSVAEIFFGTFTKVPVHRGQS